MWYNSSGKDGQQFNPQLKGKVMTMALCINCGEIKFGAICPCPKCNIASTGNFQLDITFSDHHYAVETLEEFGSVIKIIEQASEDQEVRFWAFLNHVSHCYSSILQINLPLEMQAKVDTALEGVTLPEVTLRERGLFNTPHQAD